MLLSTIASVFSVFLFAQSTYAALTPAQVVTNVKIVTAISSETNDALAMLSFTTDLDHIRTIGQKLETNFELIIKSLSADVVAMRATHPYKDGVTQPIIAALTTFVRVHQALLATVIGKHSIFAQFALTAPIAAVLRSLEATIDGFAFAMIDLIPTRKGEVQGGRDALHVSVMLTITTYNQFCVPSLLYPKRMPICITRN